VKTNKRFKEKASRHEDIKVSVESDQ